MSLLPSKRFNLGDLKFTFKVIGRCFLKVFFY